MLKASGKIVVVMTRVLSELLGASELTFQRFLLKLEAASGHNGADIRLSTEVERQTRAKLKELGLDPNDTTGSELYEALNQKVRSDNQRLVDSLHRQFGNSTDDNTLVAQAMLALPISKNCFSLQISVAKKLLSQQPPKRTMKMLNYRSFDSMLRREQVVSIFGAAWILESSTWRKAMLDHYKKLKPSDFELRQIQIYTPNSKYWQKLTAEIISQNRHNILSLKEFGSLVLLPLPEDKPPASLMATLVTSLHAMNEIRSSSTFLKLCQVKADFGKLVQTVVMDEPLLFAELLDQSVPWQIIQRYYSRFSDRFRSELFEPQVQQEDLIWHSVEKAICRLEPSLSFWRQTSNLGYLDEHRPISLNLIDAVLNYCNHLSYSDRLVHYLKSNLWHELMIRYLKHEKVEQAVLSNLQSQLIEEPVLV